MFGDHSGSLVWEFSPQALLEIPDLKERTISRALDE
jgi:hypothetical protein